MNKLQVFQNVELGSVRTTTIDGEPFFIGKDVADILGYVNSKDALASHVDSEDKSILQRSENATLDIPNRGLTVINESGLYSLILSSKLPNAKKFKRWVTSEILPSIRKTGTYSTKKVDKDKQLEIKEMNAKVRMSNQYLKIANIVTLSENYKNILIAKATETLAGQQLIPLPKSLQKTYTATQLGNIFGTTPNKIGNITNQHNLKIKEYGEWYHDKSRYSNKEVDSFRYYDSIIPILKQILITQ